MATKGKPYKKEQMVNTLRFIFENRKLTLPAFISGILFFSIVSMAFASPVTYRTTSDWGSGFNGQITVTNNTSGTFEFWELEFDFPYNIHTIWNASIKSHTGNRYVIRNASWNGKLEPGRSASFGFGGAPGDVTGTITNVKLNSNPVSGENNPPVATADSGATDRNEAVTIDVLLNDNDPDGDSVFLVAVSAQPQNGTAVIVSESEIKYTPNTDFSGTDPFNYTIEDSNGAISSGTVSVTVNDDTPAPTPTEGFEYSVTSDWGSGFNGQIRITNTTHERSNGWTIEFDYPYTINSIWNASIKSHSNDHYVIGNVSWNKALSPGQSISFGFGASPGNATKEPTNIILNMNNGAGTGPAAVDDAATVKAEKTVTINALGNDSGSGIRIVSTTSPGHGTVSFTGDEIFYTAESGYGGIDGFEYTIEDSSGNRDSATITVTVTAPPALNAADDTVSVYVNSSKTVDVLLNDTGDGISIADVTQPDNGSARVEDNKIIYTPNTNFTGSDSFDYTITGISGGNATATVFITIIEKSALDKVIVGYWHNWTDTTDGIRLSDVPGKYNVVDISFAEPVSYTDMTMKFNLDTNIQSEESFIRDIQNIQAQGRKVLISIGGANAHIRLNDSTDRDNFADSMIQIIEKYGFDGIDIDFEGGAFSIENTSSFKNPTSPLLVNAIDAVRTIIDHFSAQGKDFWLTAAPETFYLQAGISAYGGTAGSYIPFLYAFKDDLNFVAPQLYNSGSMIGLDGMAYNVGTSDFIVAMTEMLMKGFEVGNTGEIFKLRQDQVVVGLPATTQAAGSGYQTTENVLKALDYLTKGEPFGGSYQLRESSGYPDMGGIMTWSVNWDKTNGYEFANTYYDYFFGGNPEDENRPPSVSSGKQVIGYFTQWDAWKGTNHGFPAKGTCNQLNIDYSKYTILNFSFFGVAYDGSLHGADYRNKNIYLEDAVQEPAELLYGDVYSSWDYWLLYGELDLLWEATEEATEAGFVVDGNTWYNTQTTLSGSMPIPMRKEGGAKGLLELCRENNVKLVASIGGWSMCKHIPEMAADPGKKQNFLDDCARLMSMGFDGIDIDWEYPGPFSGMNYTGTEEDFENFTALMRDIRNTIGPDKILTAAFSCSPQKLAGFNWAELNPYMDYFNIMSYDINGGWSDTTGHNSPLYGSGLSWDRTFRYLTEEKHVPPSKINMGVAFYGRGVVANGPASLGAATVKTERTVQPDGPITTAADFTNWGPFEGVPNYGYIVKNTDDWIYNWDETAKVPYLTKGTYFLSYDDETSIQHKADYIMDHNAGGVIIWHAFGDWDAGAVETTFGNKLPYCPNVSTPLLDILHHTFTSD